MHEETLGHCDALPGHLTIYQGYALLLTDKNGNVSGGKNGFYFHRTRFVSRIQLRIDGTELQPISANPDTSCSLIAYALAPFPVSGAFWRDPTPT